MAAGSSNGAALVAIVDDFYFSVLAHGRNDDSAAGDDVLFPISDEKYATELQLQEVIMSSAIAATARSSAAPPRSRSSTDASASSSNNAAAAAAAAAACCFSSATTQKDPRNYALARVRSDAMATRLRRPSRKQNGGVLVSSPPPGRLISHVSLVQRDGTWLGWIDMHAAVGRCHSTCTTTAPWRGRTVRLGLALIWWCFGFFC